MLEVPPSRFSEEPPSGEFFDADEFDCHDGQSVPPELYPNLTNLIYTLDPIRERYGTAIKVVSGWRSEEWNRRVGGAVNSRHPRGDAADICPLVKQVMKQAEVRWLHRMILEMYEDGELPLLGGLGLYPNWVHVDTRPRPDGGTRIARWSGTGIGSEATG